MSQAKQPSEALSPSGLMRFDRTQEFLSLEGQAIDLWLLLLLTENENTSEFTWENICAIPDNQFDIFKGMPFITNAITKKFLASSGYVHSCHTLFSGQLKQYERCGTSEKYSPNKVNKLATLRKDPENEEVYAFRFCDLMKEYREDLLKMKEVLTDRCQTKLEELKSETQDKSEVDPVLLELITQYEELLEYTPGEDSVLPFEVSKVITRVDRLYTDLEAVLQKVPEESQKQKGLNFWRMLLTPMYTHGALLSLFYKAPPHLSNRWRDISHTVSVMHFQYLFETQPESFGKFSLILFAPERVEEMNSVLEDTLTNINVIVRDTNEFKKAIGNISNPLVGLIELCACAEVILRNDSENNQPGQQSSKKRMRTESKTISKEEFNRLMRLKEFSFSLYIFIGVLCPILNQANFPSLHDEDFFEVHDELFLFLSNCLSWAQYIFDIMYSYDQSETLFIRICQQYLEKVNDKLRGLFALRQNYLVRLMSQCTMFFDNDETIRSARMEVTSLLNPGWDDWMERSCSFRVYPRVFRRANELMQVSSLMLSSIELTSNPPNQSAHYPLVKKRDVEKLKGNMQSLINCRSSIASDIEFTINQWLNNIRSACSVSETSLEELARNYYLLGLFSSNSTKLLRCLKEMSTLMPTQKFDQLSSEITSVSTDTVQAGMRAKQRSELLRDLVFRYIAQREKMVDEMTKSPGLIDLLCQFTLLENNKDCDKFYSDCGIYTKKLEDLHAESKRFESDIGIVDDILQDCSWATQIDRLYDLVSRTNLQIANILSHYKLWNLFLSDPDFKSVDRKSLKVLTDELVMSREIYRQASKVFLEVSAEIESDENIDANEEYVWSERLESSLKPVKTRISEIEKILSGDHPISDALKTCTESFQEVGYKALKITSRLLLDLCTKIEKLSHELQPKSIGCKI